MKYVWTMCVAAALYGGAPQTAKLERVMANGVLQMRLGQAAFTCRPYGVTMLEEFAQNAQQAPECGKALSEFEKNHPDAADFARNRLKVHQFYRIERKDGACILYPRGRYSYGEWLLARGLGIMQSGFSDREWKSRLERAQKGAASARRGIWEMPVWPECVPEEKP